MITHVRSASSGERLIHALGGYNGGAKLTSIETFSASTATWTTSADTMPNTGGEVECVQSCSDPNKWFVMEDKTFLHEVTVSDNGLAFNQVDTVSCRTILKRFT